MDMETTQGLFAVGIGIVLFGMGYWKGNQTGLQNAVEALFKMGVLAVDENDQVVAGPKISKFKM
jgi:hypothetical protein